MQKSISIFYSVQEIRPFSLFQNLALGKASTDGKCHFAVVSLFSEFEPRQKLNQSQMSFDNLMGYILSISMCMQNFIIIFHSVQEIVPLSLFQNLELSKASTNEKCHFAISWARSCHYLCLRNSLSKYSTQFKRYGHFQFFRLLVLGKASTNDKCHFAIHCQYQCVCKILSKYSKRFKSKISLFSEFEPRQNLDQSQMSFDYLMGYTMSIAMCFKISSQYSTQFKR